MGNGSVQILFKKVYLRETREMINHGDELFRTTR
jgi:hypothetical protein